METVTCSKCGTCFEKIDKSTLCGDCDNGTFIATVNDQLERFNLTARVTVDNELELIDDAGHVVITIDRNAVDIWVAY